MSNFGFRCHICGFELHYPLAELKSTFVGLYSDARYPGRCLVALKEHYIDFAELPSDLVIAFIDEVRVVARAIRDAVQAERINYAILGNAVPHIHAHIIPRKLKEDPIPRRSPWSHPEPATPLKSAELERIGALIRKLLTRPQMLK